MNTITWFEIPTSNFDRAVKFYESVFGVTLKQETMFGQRMGIFPAADETSVNGCILEAEDYVPSATGATVYLNSGNDLAVPLGKVQKAGGKVLVPKTALPPGMGFFAHFIDSEGNRVGMHSMN